MRIKIAMKTYIQMDRTALRAFQKRAFKDNVDNVEIKFLYEEDMVLFTDEVDKK